MSLAMGYEEMRALLNDVQSAKIGIDELRDKYGFIFVLVAHDIRFLELADKTYEVKNGEVRLKND